MAFSELIENFFNWFRQVVKVRLEFNAGVVSGRMENDFEDVELHHMKF